MGHLKDPEELLESIHEVSAKEIMHEAWKCYASGAYRGCIVLSCIAMADDLFLKVVALGTVSSAARTLADEIGKRKSEQDVFEQFLIDKLKKEKILPYLDAEVLAEIQSKRNKAAHPSGHKPTPEEARYVFRSVIDLVLSHKRLGTTHTADEILLRINNQFFFAGRTLEAVVSTVRSEIAGVAEEAYRYLVERLGVMVASGSDIHTNARMFILGMVYLTSAKPDALVGVIEKHITDEKYSDLIMRILTHGPQILEKLSSTTQQRFYTIFASDNTDLANSKKVEDRILPFLVSYSKRFGSIEDNAMLLEVAREYVELNIWNMQVFEVVKNTSTLRLAGANKLIYLAGHNDFGTSNRAVKFLLNNDEKLVEYFEGQSAFELLVKIKVAAGIGAWSAKDIVSKGFSEMSKIKGKAASWFSVNHAKAKDEFGNLIPDFEVFASDCIAPRKNIA